MAGALQPFFLYYAFHTNCVAPDDVLQPDPEFYARFGAIADPDRRANVAMVALMDEVVGNVTAALRAAGMWERTVLLWSSDNGGAPCTAARCGTTSCIVPLVDSTTRASRSSGSTSVASAAAKASTTARGPRSRISRPP